MAYLGARVFEGWHPQLYSDYKAIMALNGKMVAKTFEEATKKSTGAGVAEELAEKEKIGMKLFGMSEKEFSERRQRYVSGLPYFEAKCEQKCASMKGEMLLSRFYSWEASR